LPTVGAALKLELKHRLNRLSPSAKYPTWLSSKSAHRSADGL
jgi:hypothetical protein